MNAIAFLQNLWVRDPERILATLRKRDEEYRRQLIKQLLFAGGLTGKRLKIAFGPLIDQIIWEEASREIGGDSATICPPDPIHIQQVIEQLEPTVILAFGKVAQAAVLPLWAGPLIYAPHPAARQVDVSARLLQAATQLRAAQKAGPND